MTAGLLLACSIRTATAADVPPPLATHPLPPGLQHRMIGQTNWFNAHSNLAGARNPAMPQLKTVPVRGPQGARRNPAVVAHPPAVKPVAVRPGTTKTNGLAAARLASSTNAPAGLAQKLKALPQSRFFYPGIAAAALLVGVALLFKLVGKKEEEKPAGALASKASAKPLKRKSNINSCNVLEVGPQARRVWQFESRSSGLVPGRQQTSLDGEPLPPAVRKDWRSLFQTKLNIAWLPSENVFLRVAQLPRSDFNETLAMVELQLEKLSPMPVAQIVWSFHVLPHATGGLQTVIVLIVARSVVEEFLGKLEGQGYLADRLELPLLDQLQATAITEDGAWVFPEGTGGKHTALVAWWYGGVLQNLDLLTLPATGRPEALKEQLMHMAWAGEMEGWLTSPPEWHLVADTAAAEWETALREGLNQPIEVSAPVGLPELAALTARRSSQTDPRANLLPSEYSERYRQQFQDRLWMRGLLAIGGLYVVGVAIYLVALSYASYRTSGVEDQAAALAPQYTNAMSLKARYQVLEDRHDLTFAALDCWNATAGLLPAGATLDHLNFTEGKRLNLSGTAPADEVTQLFDFEAAMHKFTNPKDGQPLFDQNGGESVTTRQMGNNVAWNMALVLKRSEAE